MTRKGEVLSSPIFNDDKKRDYEHLVNISVTDSGIGLKKENMKLIFKPFVQVDGSKSRRYQGTGLGLSLSKQFIELHKGCIWVESEGENKGCTFHFVIPV